jgi:hypothetical protein
MVRGVSTDALRRQQFGELFFTICNRNGEFECVPIVCSSCVCDLSGSPDEDSYTTAHIIGGRMMRRLGFGNAAGYLGNRGFADASHAGVCGDDSDTERCVRARDSQ